MFFRHVVPLGAQTMELLSQFLELFVRELFEIDETVACPFERADELVELQVNGDRVAVWSHYAGGGDAVCFIRVGTLDEPDHVPPDIHIYTSTKQPWVVLPPGAIAVPEFYDLDEQWSAESLERRRALRAGAAKS